MIKQYFIDLKERGGGSLLRYLVLPLIGFLLTAWLWTSLSGLTLVVGLCWLGIGFIWLLSITAGFRCPTPGMDIEPD